MPKLYEITDAYTPEETIDSLPIEPVLPTERPRVIINTAEFDKPKSDPLWDDVEGFKKTVKDSATGIVDAIKYASELDQKFTSNVLNLPKRAYENSENLKKGLKNLLGLGEEERYQLWPEKVVREALTSAGDIAKPNPYPEGSEQWHFYESKRQEGMVPAAMAISALAGSGGLAGTGAKAGEVALGATPFLRPALKHKEKLYKGKPGQEHQDIIPKELYEDFRQKAMSGEDLAEYNFGFINDKGHFLDREKALKYGIDTGLIDPHSGRFGALTTTLMADSSKPGVAIEAMAKANPYATDVFHGTPNNALTELKATRASKKEQMGLKGVHVAEDPAFASIYAGETGNVMPLKAQLGKMLDSTKPVVEGSPEAAFLEDLLKGTGRKPMYMEGANKGDPRVAPPLHTYIDSVGPSKAEKILDKHGYDSVKYQAKYGSLGVGGKGMNVSAESPSYLIREPSNLRSKFAKFDPDDFGKNGLLLADSSKEGAALQANKPTFYSAVEHTVKNINQSKMNGEAWLGTLANKPGVKPEELDWIGLKDFLTENKGKPVTKQQIEEHIASNNIELKEVRKGGEAGTKEKAFELAKEHGWKSWDEIDAATQAKYMQRASREAGENPTKYHSYQLPGADNYKEMLLTLPNKEQRQYGFEWFDPATQKSRAYATEAEAKANAPAGAVVSKTEIGPTLNPAYKSSHWDEPNILAHVRMNDRNIDGKKSLHLEEIQSDWHQQGRDKGYRNEGRTKQVIQKELDGLLGELRNRTGEYLPTDKHWAEHKDISAKFDALSKELKAAKNGSEGVPDAPFKKTWHELALKRMLREAAEKGYDRLSWTPGEAQAARYDLSKQVDTISAMGPDKNGKYLTYIEGKDKQPLFRNRDGFSEHGQKTMTAEELEATVGKEVAKKLMEGAAKNKNNERTNGFFDLKGDGLKIGGEGMKGFYDQIIPKSVNKIAKEYGVKVEKGKTSEGHDIFYIDLPEGLKNTALRKGFPLFSNVHPGYSFIPYAGNPFENEK